MAAIFNLNHPAHVRALALLRDVGVEPRRDRADARRVRARRSCCRSRPPRSVGSSLVSRRRERRLLDRRAARAGGRALPPEKLLPDEQPSYCRLVDLRVRRAVARVAGRDHRLGHDPGAEGARLVALHRRRALLQQHPPVGGRAVLLLHGHPPVGQVLDGGLARRPRARLDDRRGHVPGRDPVRADRLRLAAELRRAVDLDPGQGRDELGRDRRVLQPPELRPDVQLPRAAAAGRRGRARRRARPAGAQARGRAAVPAAGSTATTPAGADACHCRARTSRSCRHEPPGRDSPTTSAAAQWKGAYRPYDLVKERRSRSASCSRSPLAADDPVLLARRAAEHDQAVVAHRSGRLRHHRHQRARRLEHHGRLRPAVQPRTATDSTIAVHPPAEVARRQPPDQHRPGLRDRAAAVDPRPARRFRRAVTDLPVRRSRQDSRRRGRPRTTNALGKAKANPDGSISVPAGRLRAGADDDDRAAGASPRAAGSTARC